MGRKKNEERVTGNTARPTEVTLINIATLVEALNNPPGRLAALAELTASIKARGVLNPIIVRPYGGGGDWEIVCGHRRVVAAREAGLTEVPALIRHLNDDQAAEVALIDNLQREGLAPLDEAAAYRTLRDERGWPATEIAARVGKSVAHVTQRIVLLDLPDAAKAAVNDGSLEIRAALAIARLPDEKDRARAAQEILATGKRYLPGGGGEVKTRCTTAEALAWIKANCNLRLKGVAWPLDDDTLVERAGACAACPKRSGNAPLLFADLADEDLCTDGACFAEKKNAAWLRRAAAAKRAGQKVLSKKEVKEVFPHGDHYNVAYNSPLVPLDDGAPYEVDPTNKHTWFQLLCSPELDAKERPKIILARAPDGEVVELVEKDAALAALKAAGLLPKAEKQKHSALDERYAAQEKSAREDRAREKLIAALAIKRIGDIIRAEDDEDDLWRALSLNYCCRSERAPAWAARLVDAAALRGKKKKEQQEIIKRAATDHLGDKAIGGTAWLIALIVEQLLAEHESDWAPLTELLKAVCAATKIDLDEIEKELAGEKKEKRGKRKGGSAEEDPVAARVSAANPAAKKKRGRPKKEKGGSTGDDA